MADMTDSIAPRSDQMNAEDLLTGPRTFTITEVRILSSPEQPVWVFFAEHPQPFKPSKTVRRLMVFAWGPDSAAYVGKRMTLYRDPDVRFGGQDVGGIRVSHMSGITRRLEVALSVTRGRRAPFVVEPLADEALAPLDALVFAFNAAGITGKAERLKYSREVIHRNIRTAIEMTPGEMNAVVAALNPAQVPDEPAHQEFCEALNPRGDGTCTCAVGAEPARAFELDIPDPLEPSDAEIEAARRREAEQS